MNGSFRDAWAYLAADLWEPLDNYSVKDAAAPVDLFSDLFAVASEFLSLGPTGRELEEARNDPAKARQRFLALQGTDFVSESAIVHFLEAANEVITEYEMPAFKDLYRRLVRDALRKFNLRYRLDEPFVLRFLLPGSFANLYMELHRLNATNGHLTSLLSDFEKAFDRYARTQDATDLKTCIAKASKHCRPAYSNRTRVSPLRSSSFKRVDRPSQSGSTSSTAMDIHSTTSARRLRTTIYRISSPSGRVARKAPIASARHSTKFVKPVGSSCPAATSRCDSTP
jgi:hypothetical protein